MNDRARRWPEIEAWFRAAGSGAVAVFIAETETIGSDGAERNREVARRREFIAGRELAGRCLSAIGQPPQRIGRGPSREPLWPAGVTGSITHCDGVVAVVVAQISPGLCSVGIDVEEVGAVAPPVFAEWFTPNELTRLDPGDRERATIWFSAKEALFKAISPIARRFVEPLEVELDDGDGVLRVVSAPSCDVGRMSLFAGSLDGRVATAAVISE